MRAGRFVLACALVAASCSGAHAGDVQSPAVEFGDLCEAYGPGFKAVGDTEICLRISGSVAVETGFVAGADDGIGKGRGRDDDRWTSRAEGRAALETRMETDIGTIRTFVEIEGDGLDDRR